MSGPSSRDAERDLADTILDLALRVRRKRVTVTALGDITRCFSYHKSFSDVAERDVHAAIKEFEAACTATFGSVPAGVVLRFRKGTVQADDLRHFFNIPVSRRETA